MSKYKISYIQTPFDVEKLNTLTVGQVTYDKQYNIEIQVDDEDEDTVWINLLNADTGEVEEGGSFSKEALIEHILNFYNKHF